MAHLAFERNPTQHIGVLQTRNFAPLTLQGVVAEVEIHDFTARVQLTVEYKNSTSQPQSVFVAFAQISGWTISSIKTEAPGRWVSTSVGTDDNSAVPQTPESEVFVPRVATQAVPWELLVHDSIVSTVMYYAPVELVDQRKLQFVVPKVLFPLRIDVEDAARLYNSAFEVKSAVGSGKLARTVYMHVRGRAVSALEKPPVILAGDNAVGQCNKNTFSAKWESHAADLRVTEDLVFEAVLAPTNGEPLTLSLWKDVAASDADRSLVPIQHAFAGTASIAPCFTSEQLATINNEIVFLLDASASMLPAWSEVVRSVKLAVSSLPPSTYVNVVWFGETTEFLYPNGSELLTQRIRDEIVDDLLGFALRAPTTQQTKLYQAIQNIYKQAYVTGFVRNIVLLTDTGAEEHLALRTADIVRSNVHSTRFSAVAVGAAAHKTYLKLLCHEGRGEYFEAGLPSEVPLSVARVIQAVHVPTLVNVVARTEYDGNAEDVPPVLLCKDSEHMACIPLGHRTQLPFFASLDVQPFTVVVSGMIGLHHVDYKAQSGDLRSLDLQSMTEAGRPESSSILHVAAALKRIERLTSGSDHSAMTQAEKHEAAILSTAFFIPSPTVSYVSCNSRSPVPVLDRQTSSIRFHNSRAHRRVALGDGLQRPAIRDATGMRVTDGDQQQRANVAAQRDALANVNITTFVRNRVIDEIVRLAVDGGAVDDVLLSQTAAGSFAPSSRLFAGIGITAEAFLASKPADADEHTWATSLACAWLDSQDASIATLGVCAALKGTLALKASGNDGVLSTAKRVLQR